METPLLSQKPITFPVKQNLADIYDLHPQIMSWENETNLQTLTKPQNQVSSISSSTEVFPTYHVVHTLANSQNYNVSQTFITSHVSTVPQTSTAQVLPVMNIEPAFDSSVYVDDLLISEGNLLRETPYVCESQTHQMVPLHTTSNLVIETQTCLSDLSQTYYAGNDSIEDTLLNLQSNCISSNDSKLQKLSFAKTNHPTLVTSVENDLNYENEAECINQDWSKILATQQCHSTCSSFHPNEKAIKSLDYQDTHLPPGPEAITYIETTQPSVERKNVREGRNKIEKQRRDKLNQSIVELSYLVPQVANSNRKLDKTSILRLSAHYLRSYNYVFRDVKPAPTAPSSGFSPSSVQTALSLLKGFLLTTTYKGIVVLASHNISEYLGYNEVDLLGHNILNIVHKDDTYIMIEQLKPKPKLLGPNGELIITDEPGAAQKVAEQLAQDKRKFIVRFKRYSQRSNPGQYVSCYVEGSFRKSDKARGFTQPLRRIRARATNPCSSGNDIVFIGVVRPIASNIHAEKKIDTFHTEYITYHSIDGEITECDKRISLATGYMTQEVMGINAMNFIHRDDVQCVVIALQQMYDKHKLFSESFYRLMIKNGQFIYMRTRGYLQVDDSSGVVNALICNNTIIEEDEGERMLKVMKNKFSASAIQNTTYNDGDIESPKSPVAVVDPKDLLNAVFRMIQSVSVSSKDSRENDLTSGCNSSALRLTFKPPKKERIVSAIQKMYTFIKTFQQDIQQAQNTLNNQRSLNLMKNNNYLQEIDYFDRNLDLRSTDYEAHKCKDNNNIKYNFVFGKESNTKKVNQNQSYRMSKINSRHEDNEEFNSLSARSKQVLNFEPLLNKQETRIKAYCNDINKDSIQNICKIGVKRSNEYTNKVVCKKKVTNYENLEQNHVELPMQDKPLDNYFSDEDLQKHIEQTIDELSQNESPSLADLIDFDEFLKNFENETNGFLNNIKE